MFKQDVDKFLHSKSNWTGMGMILGGVVGLQSGTIEPFNASQMIVGGFALIFVKDAIEGKKL